MSPRPPSTLSAARAQAASRPLDAPGTSASPQVGTLTLKGGLSRGAVTAARTTSTVVPRPSTKTEARTVGAGTAPIVRPTAPGVQRRVSTRETLERRVMLGVLVVCGVALLIFLGLRIVDSTQQADGRVTIDQSFAKVHVRQREYHSLFGRFATWPELEQRGVRLAPRQSAIAWNADASHWFMSVKDVNSGLICDRTGEIFDEDWSERVSVCRPPK